MKRKSRMGNGHAVQLIHIWSFTNFHVKTILIFSTITLLKSAFGNKSKALKIPKNIASVIQS